MTSTQFNRNAFYSFVLLCSLAACDSSTDAIRLSASEPTSSESTQGQGGTASILNASAGADQIHTYTGAMAIPLDGGQSQFDSGTAQQYSWSVVSGTGSTAARIDNASSANAVLHVSASGVYVVELAVSDANGNADTDRTEITVNSMPVANVTGPDNVQAGSTVNFDGTSSLDDERDALTYSWRLIESPDTSAAALNNTTGSVSSLSVDTEGAYTVQLVVNDGLIDSAPEEFRLVAHRNIAGIDFQPLDAEYNPTNDTIVMVSASPSRLHIHNPDSGVTQSVVLPTTPTSVSVNPAGTHAAVGHDGLVSYVDLMTPSLVNSWPVSVVAGDVVLAGNDHAYVFPETGQWVRAYSVNTQTGVSTQSSGYSIRQGTHAKLHPDGDVIYGADNGLSPSDIEKYRINGGGLSYLYDSPYHGEFSFCGDLWLAEDGQRVFTRCGVVVRSTASQSTDMVYNGSLEGLSKVTSLDHSSAADEVVAIPEDDFWEDTNADTQLRYFDYAFLAPKSTVELPMFIGNGEAHTSHGRYVFYSSTGDKVHVIVQANEASGYLNDYGIVSYDR